MGLYKQLVLIMCADADEEDGPVDVAEVVNQFPSKLLAHIGDIGKFIEEIREIRQWYVINDDLRNIVPQLCISPDPNEIAKEIIKEQERRVTCEICGSKKNVDHGPILVSWDPHRYEFRSLCPKHLKEAKAREPFPGNVSKSSRDE